MKQHTHKSWHNLLDLRVLLVLMMLSLLLGQWRPVYWALPDTALVELRQWLHPLVRTPPKVALLNLDRPERDLWQSLGSSSAKATEPRLARALDALAAQSKVIGLALPYPVDSFDLNSVELQALLSEGDTKAVKALRAQIESRQGTRELIASNQIVLGLTSGRMADQPSLDVEYGLLTDFSAFRRAWLWPVYQPRESVVFPPATFGHFPILTRQALEQPLLFEDDDGIHLGFALQLLHQLYAMDNSEEGPLTPRWLRDTGLKMGSHHLPLGANGKLVPLVTEYSTMAPSFERLSLAAAIARPVTSSIVLVGSSDNPVIERLAATVAALADGLVLVEPVWYAPLNKALLLALLGALILLAPRINFLPGLMVCAGVAVLLGLLNLGAQFIWQWWLPVADLLWPMLVGFAVIQFWHAKHSRRLETQRRLRLMSIAHAQRLTEMGELEQAQQTLTSYAATHQAFQPYMQLANAFASQGNYHQALNTIAALRPPRDKKEEFREKQQHWAQLAGTATLVNEQGNLASTQVLELAGPKVLGRYELKRELGRGAMGTVYLAYDPKIDRKVAIKTLNFKQFEASQLTDLKARFYREAAAAGRLNHPNIVSVFDVGEEEDLAYIAMDYIEGQSLSQFVSDTHLLEPFEVYRAVANVARALDYAHHNNVIHRDIKPANIMYAADPYQLKVADFGIARLVDNSRTSTGEILGSPLYMAPEQLQGKTITPGVDLFSLGVTFYQLLTGQLPFNGDNLGTLTYEIIYSKPESVRKICPELPSSATRIVNRALQKDVNKRFESAAEMADALEKAMRRDFTDEAKAAGYINR